MLSSDDLRFFATVATARTLAAAARALGVTPSAVTQRLRQLEARVGVRLVHRTGRATTLTDEGALPAERGGDLVAALDTLTDDLGGAATPSPATSGSWPRPASDACTSPPRWRTSARTTRASPSS